ncbi:DASH family cryptochrome [Bowmanella denitrificans]|uniref:DASH family cryptochrome n=1 Tax=Bowmanella denitrificans TaxID=366582 RepID=UPI001FEBF339|nr:DASH family cryptochrome [Bowmanella denitrificans]
MKHGLFVFTRDLRVQDNQALAAIARQVDRLDCLYIADPEDQQPGRYTCRGQGIHARRFLQQSLSQLQQTLQLFGQHLHVLEEEPLTAVCRFVQARKINLVGQSAPFGVYEQALTARLAQKLAAMGVDFQTSWQHTLFDRSQLPFDLTDLPKHFTPFRQLVEPLFSVVPPVERVILLPPPVAAPEQKMTLSSAGKPGNTLAFQGGCQAGAAHLHTYFNTDAPLTYKDTRNALDCPQSSTRFSPWLAFGCLSVRQIWQRLRQFEQDKGANQSTYWIKFELLWREYFHWYLQRYQSQVFRFAGIHSQPPLTSFHAGRFAKWCMGNTPYPLVNAVMRQLNQTGYISNRARQIAASCWLNELQGDWRYGAAYFQQQLIDYDVAANWGNWQYLAGVGADPRGGRWFDLHKQGRLYDPQGQFIRRWGGEDCDPQLDHQDAADWPLPDTDANQPGRESE